MKAWIIGCIVMLFITMATTTVQVRAVGSNISEILAALEHVKEDKSPMKTTISVKNPNTTVGGNIDVDIDVPQKDSETPQAWAQRFKETIEKVYTEFGNPI